MIILSLYLSICLALFLKYPGSKYTYHTMSALGHRRSKISKENDSSYTTFYSTYVDMQVGSRQVFYFHSKFENITIRGRSTIT